jgi:hypothetical protein
VNLVMRIVNLGWKACEEHHLAGASPLPSNMLIQFPFLIFSRWVQQMFYFVTYAGDGLLHYTVPLLASSSLWLVVTHVFSEIVEKLVESLVHIRTVTDSM